MEFNVNRHSENTKNDSLNSLSKSGSFDSGQKVEEKKDDLHSLTPSTSRDKPQNIKEHQIKQVSNKEKINEVNTYGNNLASDLKVVSNKEGLDKLLKGFKKILSDPKAKSMLTKETRENLGKAFQQATIRIGLKEGPVKENTKQPERSDSKSVNETVSASGTSPVLPKHNRLQEAAENNYPRLKALITNTEGKKIIYDSKSETYSQKGRGLLSFKNRAGRSLETPNTVSSLIIDFAKFAKNSGNPELKKEAIEVLKNIKKTDDSKVSPWINTVIKNNPRLLKIIDTLIDNLKEYPEQMPNTENFQAIKDLITDPSSRKKIVRNENDFIQKARSLFSLNNRVGNNQETQKAVKLIIAKLSGTSQEVFDRKNVYSAKKAIDQLEETSKILNDLKNGKGNPWICQVIKNQSEVLDELKNQINQIPELIENLKKEIERLQSNSNQDSPESSRLSRESTVFTTISPSEIEELEVINQESEFVDDDPLPPINRANKNNTDVESSLEELELPESDDLEELIKELNISFEREKVEENINIPSHISENSEIENALNELEGIEDLIDQFSSELFDTSAVAEKIIIPNHEVNENSALIPTKLAEDPKTLSSEAFAEKAFESLKADQGLEVKEGLLGKIVDSKFIPTGQREKDLKDMFTTQYKVAHEMEAKFYVRLKMGNAEDSTGFKHSKQGGETRFIMINLQGNVENTVKKAQVLGSGTFGKAKKIDTEEGEKVVKSTFIDKKSEIKLTKNQQEEHLERAGNDILNEKKKLNMVHSGEIMPGVQHRLEHTVMILQGDSNNLKIKIGHLGAAYSGDADLFDKDATLKEDDWTDGWELNEIIKGCQVLTEGLSKSHNKKGLFYGDIKGANILRDDKTKGLFLADLGGSQDKTEIWTEKDGPNMNFTRTEYATCELDVKALARTDTFEDCLKIREKMDVYSLGTTLYEWFTKKPFDQSGEDPLTKKGITQDIKHHEKNLPAAQELGALIAEMVSIDFNNRLTSADAYKKMSEIAKKFS